MPHLRGPAFPHTATLAALSLDPASQAPGDAARGRADHQAHYLTHPADRQPCRLDHVRFVTCPGPDQPQALVWVQP